MILSDTGGLIEVSYCLLKAADGTKIRYFSTSEEVAKYLKANVDIGFLLEASKLGDILTGTDKSKYGPEFGDIFCGQVRFDSKTNQIVCS